MVVCRFRLSSIPVAVATLLGSYYCFNMEFPKGTGGIKKKTTFFVVVRTYVIRKCTVTLPLSVEHVLAGLIKVNV